jgi:hypothetical protein
MPDGESYDDSGHRFGLGGGREPGIVRTGKEKVTHKSPLSYIRTDKAYLVVKALCTLLPMHRLRQPWRLEAGEVGYVSASHSACYVSSTMFSSSISKSRGAPSNQTRILGW